MKIILNSLGWLVIRFLLIALGILAIFYIQWFLLDSPLKYKSYHFDEIGIKPLIFYIYSVSISLGFISSIETVILLIIYGVLWLITQKVKIGSALRPLLVFISIAIFFMNCVIVFFIPDLVTGVTCNGTTYIITDTINDNDWDYYTLETRKGLFDVKKDFMGYDMTYYSSRLACDKNMNLVRVFRSSIILREAYGSQHQRYIYDYIAEADDTRHNIVYMLYSYEEDNLLKYLITACQDNNKPDTCQFIPISYTTPSQEDGNLKIVNDELEVFIGEKAISTYNIP